MADVKSYSYKQGGWSRHPFEGVVVGEQVLTRRSHIEPRKQRPSSSLLMPLSTWCHSTTKSSLKLIFREAVNCQYGGHGGSLLHAAVAEGDRKSTSMLISAGARFLNYQFKPKLCYFSESYNTQSIIYYLPFVAVNLYCSQKEWYIRAIWPYLLLMWSLIPRLQVKHNGTWICPKLSKDTQS